MRPSGSGGAWASALLALLDDVPASPASRRLACTHAALGTRHILILGQAPGQERIGRIYLIIDGFGIDELECRSKSTGFSTG
jgi:hypothetical protein